MSFPPSNSAHINQPSKTAAYSIFVLIIAMLAAGMTYQVDIKILLLLALTVTVLIAMLEGWSFTLIMDSMRSGIVRAFPALCIFILIGALIGSWIQGGIIQALIFYGLQILNPAFFLPAGLLVCSLVSLATGTSWGTAGTIGVAFMAMGQVLGIPAPVTAGMVVSGAFFGDKLSPLSDTTNLAATATGADLFAHIHSILLTTVPSYFLSLVAFYAAGRNYHLTKSTSSTQVSEFLQALQQHFVISPWLLLPIVAVLLMNVLRVPALIALMSGALLGVLCSVVCQGDTVVSALNAMNSGYDNQTGVSTLDTLLNRGGIANMMETFALSFIALCLGALLDELGYLRVVMKGILQQVKRLGSLVTLVIGACFLTNGLMGEVYLSIIVNGNLFRQEFSQRGLQPAMLSRTLEEGATLTGPLIPWTTAGAFMGGVLGVSAFDYAPYTFFNLINPVLAIVFAFFGLAVLRDKTKPTTTVPPSAG